MDHLLYMYCNSLQAFNSLCLLQQLLYVLHPLWVQTVKKDNRSSIYVPFLFMFFSHICSSRIKNSHMMSYFFAPPRFS